MIRILFISRLNLLAGRTNVYNFAKTCEAVNAMKGLCAELVTTDQERDKETFFRKMGVHKQFEITCLQATNTASELSNQSWYQLAAFIQANFSLAWFMLKRFRKFDAIYFRDESLAPVAIFAKSFLHKKVFFEIHSVLESASRQLLNRLAVRCVHGVVAISSGLKRYYEKLNAHIIVSLCSAAEDSWFDHARSKNEFRKELGLPEDRYLAGYTGVVGANPNNDYYEIDDIVRSLASLPEAIMCVIVGELNGNAEWLREIAKESGVLDRVIILPWQERSVIPKYLQAFDSILIPKRKKDLIGDSPAKMFPALASRRPIIAGQAESIEEVLTNEMDAIFVKENTPDGWRKAILDVYSNPQLAEKISHQAEITKAKYTWEKRGVAIGNFIQKTIDQ